MCVVCVMKEDSSLHPLFILLLHNMKSILPLLLLISLVFSCDKFDKHVNMFCKFGKEESTCLWGTDQVDAAKRDCCSKGCSFVAFNKEKVCCLTDQCLDRCYPGKGYKSGKVY